MVRMVDEEMEVIVDFCRRSRVVHARVTVEFATTSIVSIVFLTLLLSQMKKKKN